MTRINVVHPSTLSRQHLVAEYREITRLPGNLRDSLERKNKPFSLDEIPKQYVLGPGHVKYFYDKMLFLQKRFESLVAEMISRGYKPTFTDSSIFTKCDSMFYNDYVPTDDAIRLNLERIKERSERKKENT